MDIFDVDIVTVNNAIQKEYPRTGVCYAWERIVARIDKAKGSEKETQAKKELLIKIIEEL